MKTIYYSELEIKNISSLVVGSSQDKLVYLGVNSNDLDIYARKINYQAKIDINSNKIIIEQLKQYFLKEINDFSIETEFLTGTEFQKQVWNELKQIPYGKTISYKHLSGKINKPNASRAVGNANGKNPIPIVFPCHRVINSNGGLGGYSYGLKFKKYLLELEQSSSANI